MHGTTDNLEVRVLGAPIAAGAAVDSDSAIIDMAGYESATFVAAITASVATGKATLTLEGADTNSGAAMAAIANGAAEAVDAGSNDLKDTALVVDVFKPAKRYLRVNRASDVANITYGSLTVVLRPHRRPVAQHASVAARAVIAG